jgi:hypothetical protein
MFGRADWLENFQAWVARLSPTALADLIDVLAVELRERDVGDHQALGQAAAMVRAHQGVRVQQLVDAFLVGSPSASDAPSTTDGFAGRFGGPI